VIIREAAAARSATAVSAYPPLSAACAATFLAQLLVVKRLAG
jgi:hypothetical protein